MPVEMPVRIGGAAGAAIEEAAAGEDGGTAPSGFVTIVAGGRFSFGASALGSAAVATGAGAIAAGEATGAGLGAP